MAVDRGRNFVNRSGFSSLARTVGVSTVGERSIRPVRTFAIVVLNIPVSVTNRTGTSSFAAVKIGPQALTGMTADPDESSAMLHYDPEHLHFG
jgi:hypothetical protein